MNKIATYIANAMIKKAFAEEQLAKLANSFKGMEWHMRGISFCNAKPYYDVSLDEREQPYPTMLLDEYNKLLTKMIAKDKDLNTFLSRCSDVAVSHDLQLPLSCELARYEYYISGKIMPAAHSQMAGPIFHVHITGKELDHPARLLLAQHGYEILAYSEGLNAIGFHDGEIFLRVADGYEALDPEEFARNFYFCREYASEPLDAWIVISRNPISPRDFHQSYFSESFGF